MCLVKTKGHFDKWKFVPYLLQLLMIFFTYAIKVEDGVFLHICVFCVFLQGPRNVRFYRRLDFFLQLKITLSPLVFLVSFYSFLWLFMPPFFLLFLLSSGCIIMFVTYFVCLCVFSCLCIVCSIFCLCLRGTCIT